MPGLEGSWWKTLLLTSMTEVVNTDYHEKDVDAVRIRAQVDEKIERIAERKSNDDDARQCPLEDDGREWCSERSS